MRELSAIAHIVAERPQGGLRRRAISWLKARSRILRSRASALLARAAAAGTPPEGLFRATTPQDYAPLGRDCIHISRDELDTGSVAQRTLMHLETRCPNELERL